MARDAPGSGHAPVGVRDLNGRLYVQSPRLFARCTNPPCGYVVPPVGRACPYCGHPLEVVAVR